MIDNQPLGQSLAKIERHLGKLWRADENLSLFQQISFNEYDYLQAVKELGNPRLSDLAEMLSVTKPSASNMVNKLQKKGLLRRQPAPNDGRAILISLTDAGKNLMALDDKIFQKLTDKVKTALSADDYRELERLLTAVCKQL